MGALWKWLGVLSLLGWNFDFTMTTEEEFDFDFTMNVPSPSGSPAAPMLDFELQHPLARDTLRFTLAPAAARDCAPRSQFRASAAEFFPRHHPGAVEEGEGCHPGMGVTGATVDLLSALPQANIHATTPPIGHGLSNPTMLHGIKKRSYRRALRRCAQHGFTWYRNQIIKGIPAPTPPSPCPSPPRPRPTTPQPSPKHRLTIFHWNVSGLSQSKLQELMHWGHTSSCDIMLLTETRWTFSNQWHTTNWTITHSGQVADRGAGVALLVHKRVPRHHLSWREVQPGRVLHVKLHSKPFDSDFLIVYQHPYQQTLQRSQQRQQLLHCLDQYLTHLPNRNLFVMGGDFNTGLQMDVPCVGCSSYKHLGRSRVSKPHSDSQDLGTILQNHQLIALNTFDTSSPPTYVQHMESSRIDFIMMRANRVDSAAKHPAIDPHLPFVNRACGHLPIVASVPRHWYPHTKTRPVGFTFRHRLACIKHLEQHDQMFEETITTAITSFTQHTYDVHDYITKLHEAVRPGVEAITSSPLKPQRPDSDTTRIIQDKWSHFRAMRNATAPILPNIFHAWHHWSKFRKADKQHRQYNKQQKKQQVEQLMIEAGRCAALNNAQGLPSLQHTSPTLPIDYIRSQEWGPRVLAMGTNWRAFAEDRELCEHLAKTCALCGEWCGRMQELTLHYQHQHSDVVPWMTPLSHQITRLLQQDNDDHHACAFCLTTYRHQHTCPVTTQLAAITYQISSTQDLLPCLLCNRVPETLTELQLHLLTDHDLKTITWNPARDALRGEPCCRHCHQKYSVMNGLKQHIQQGRCPAFNIEAAPIEPSIDEQLQEAFWTGQLTQVLAEAQVRLKLAHTCQLCERSYDRSADLMVHLQQQHASLYHRGLNLQRYLLNQLYQDMGCLCAPTVTQETLTHVCPLFVQVAILHAKSRTAMYMQPTEQWPPHGGILIPGHFTEARVTALVHASTPDEVKDSLTTMLCGHQWTNLWQNLAVNLHLRCTCLQCGVGPLSPGALHNHLLEDHAKGLPGLKHMLAQLLDPMWHTASNMHTCDCCKLTFCLPDSLQIVSKCLAQEHWSHQCPVALQIAGLLSNHHGSGLRTAGGGDGPSDARSLPGTESLPSTRPRRAQRRQTPSGGRPDQGRRKSQRQALGDATEPAHPSGTISRAKHQSDAPTGLLRFVSQPRCKRSAEDPGVRSCDLEEITDGETPSATLVPDIAGGTEGAHHQAAPTGSATPVERHAGEEALAERREFPVSSMESNRTPDAVGSENTIVTDEAAGLHAHRHVGPDLGGGPNSAIPCPSTIDPGIPTETPSHTMETATQHERQLPALPSEPPQPLHSVEPCRPPAQAAQPDDEWTGPAATTDDYGEPEWGESQEQRQGQEAVTTNLLMEAVARVTLCADSQFPFANAAFKALCWAHLCSDQPLQTFWGSRYGDVTKWLAMTLQQEQPCTLLPQSWNEALVTSWGMELKPSNVAEFTQSLWFWLHPSNQMAWERRDEKGGTDDSSIGQIPLSLEPSAGDHVHYMLQTLIECWSQTDSMCTAFLHADPVICCHLNRHEDLWGVRPRLAGELVLNSPTQIPYFAADGSVNYQDYEPIACVLHVGPYEPGRSSYKALLRIRIEGSLQWLLCTDDEDTMQLEHLTDEMASQISLVWLCNLATFTMPELRPKAIAPDPLVEMISRS
eukprot:Skav235066  [mRNA]  locus=scaffold3466:163:7116:- [translate_table: standard]